MKAHSRSHARGEEQAGVRTAQRVELVVTGNDRRIERNDHHLRRFVRVPRVLVPRPLAVGVERDLAVGIRFQVAGGVGMQSDAQMVRPCPSVLWCDDVAVRHEVCRRAARVKKAGGRADRLVPLKNRD